MITKREIAQIATAFRVSAPLVRQYSPARLEEMNAAANQWRADVIRVAIGLEFAQKNSKNPTFNRDKFLRLCGIVE